MDINKDFIDTTNKLIEQKETLEMNIRKRFKNIETRMEEMRAKYRVALDELQKETDDYHFYGFSRFGWREIKKLTLYRE